MLIPLLLACASDAPVWALNTMSVVPMSTGLTGTQTWTFYTSRWGKSKDDGAFVCARAQTYTAVVTSPVLYEGCADCLFAYELTYAELDSDCDEDLAVDPAYQLPEVIAIGAVDDTIADLDPQGGESMGWYAQIEAGTVVPYGFAWDDAIDWGGYPGPPGWNEGQVYTLWPAFAWDLAETPS